MASNDSISDMLTRIRNGLHRKQDEVRVRSSKAVISVAEALKSEGYIQSFEIVPSPLTKVQNDLVIKLKYGRGGDPVINKIDRISKPGCRVYATKDQLKPVLRGLGIWVVSTSKGVMSDRQARTANVGGEVICRVE